MVLHLGLIFCILGYPTLSLGWPVDCRRRTGMVHLGCGIKREENTCSRAFYRTAKSSHTKGVVIPPIKSTF
jgi:hypothetical protein